MNSRSRAEAPRARQGALLGHEGGFALIGALLIMVLVTALGSAAVFVAQTDLMLAGNYRVQRTAEASADGSLELVKAMIFGNTTVLNLPLSIPATDIAAKAWRAGADTTGDGIGDGVSYSDGDIDVTYTIKYKQEDSVNFYIPNSPATGTCPSPVHPHPADHVVRYGNDYNFQSAQRCIGKQPVYTATFADNRTGIKGEADLISTIGFNTPAALFCGGRVHMQNFQWATEETIEVTAGTGTPAVATASTSANITIETVLGTTTFLGTTKLATAAAHGDGSITVLSNATYGTANFPAAGQFVLGPGKDLVTYTGKTATTFTGCTGVPVAPVGTFVNVTSGNRSYNAMNVGVPPATSNNIPYAVNPSYLHQRVYRPAEVKDSRDLGLYYQAQESAHLLLGVGDKTAKSRLDEAYTNAGGGSAGAAAADDLFRFYIPSPVSPTPAGYDSPVAFDNSVTPHACSGIVCYGYQMPTAQAPLTQLETMFGQSFADLRTLADQVFTCTSTVNVPAGGGTSNYGCNLSGVALGTPSAPQVVYFNGTGTTAPVALVTNANTQVSGAGILIIDGDAEIVGSINWQGLMLIRGNLTFRPWQGGTAAARSGSSLATTWNGFLIIGGDLDLWTYWGGSIFLGYSSTDVAAIKGIISATVPHKILSWRRTYH